MASHGVMCLLVQTMNSLLVKLISSSTSLRWRHNEHNDVSNHQPHDCLLKRSLRWRPKEKSRLRVTGLCAGNSPVTGEFPAQMASNVKNVSIWCVVPRLLNDELQGSRIREMNCPDGTFYDLTSIISILNPWGIKKYKYIFFFNLTSIWLISKLHSNWYHRIALLDCDYFRSKKSLINWNYALAGGHLS